VHKTITAAPEYAGTLRPVVDLLDGVIQMPLKPLRKIDELLVRAEAQKAGLDARIRRFDAEIGPARAHFQALIDVKRENRGSRGHEQFRTKARRLDKES